MDLTTAAVDSLKLMLQSDVSGIAVDSFLGEVLIAAVIGTFLITLIGGIITIIYYVRKTRDRAAEDVTRCQRHEDNISAIQEGFTELKSDIKGVHIRVDSILGIISTSANFKNQPYTRKG
jgi:hypothetical protein